MKLSCGICSGLHGQLIGTALKPWDHVLLRSDSFVAVPSRGSIVPGWVLVVSSDHLLSMGAVEQGRRQELAEFVSEVRAMVESAFGPSVVFEHGPASPKLRVGCGVDHAHLHVVPTDIDLLAGIPAVFPSQIAWREISGLSATAELYRRNESYLYVEPHLGGCWLGTHSHLPSQLFRKVIANAVGSPERFDWVAYPEVENVLATINAFGVAADAVPHLAADR